MFEKLKIYWYCEFGDKISSFTGRVYVVIKNKMQNVPDPALK